MQPIHSSDESGANEQQSNEATTSTASPYFSEALLAAALVVAFAHSHSMAIGSMNPALTLASRLRAGPPALRGSGASGIVVPTGAGTESEGRPLIFSFELGSLSSEERSGFSAGMAQEVYEGMLHFEQLR